MFIVCIVRLSSTFIVYVFFIQFERNFETFSFYPKDSDTNFIHTFSLCSYAFLMKKSTASCFESSINTRYEHN